MTSQFHFTYKNLEAQYCKAIEEGYVFMTCEQYVHHKTDLPPRTIVNRVDIDYSCKKAGRLCGIFDRLGIKASFFVRLHASEYNPFSFENYRVLKMLRDSGHEIGYHSEIVDQSVIWNEEAEDCLKRDIEVLHRMLDIEVKGVASHGGITGLNNLDFWKNRKPGDYGLLYEAYDQQPSFNLMNESFYISDSEWVRWKCYNKGQRVEDDHRSFAEHLDSEHSLIYLLIHSDTYFDQHFYE